MIIIENLGLEFYPEKAVLKDLSVSLQPGNIYGLLGKNGSGKSSLLKIMMGLLKAQSGTCSVFGKTASKRYPSVLQDIFLVPENLPGYSPVSIRSYAKMNGDFFHHFDFNYFIALLKQFNIDEHFKLQHLSKGQLRVVFTCFGIATRSKILLLDEANDGVDAEAKETIRKILISDFTDNRIILIATHQVQDLDGIIDHVLILDTHSIVLDRSIQEINFKFSSKLVSQKTDHDLMLYAESTLRGKVMIIKRFSEEEAEVPLELFYKAFLKNRAEVTKILND